MKIFIQDDRLYRSVGVFSMRLAFVSDAFRMHFYLEELLTKLFTTLRRVYG